jgi:hypothetical protein
VAAIALGVAETIIRQHNKAKFDNYVFANPSDPSHPIAGYCNTDIVMPECKPLQDAFNRSNTLMIVGYAAGGALAVGSAVLFLLSPPRGGDAGAQSTALACAPVVGGGEQLMSCRLDF